MKRLLAWTLVGAAWISLVSGCNNSSEDEDIQSIRDRVVSASRGYRTVDSVGNTGHFAETGFYDAFHSADWKVEDPFTDATKHYLGPSLLSHSYPYREVHQAIARSIVSTQQVFIVHGEDPELTRRLRERRADWAGSKVTGMPDVLVSKDGLELTYEVFHVKPGVLSGDELLLEVAYLEEGRELLLLDAGISYGRPPSGTLLAQPFSHASLKQMVSDLELKALF